MNFKLYFLSYFVFFSFISSCSVLNFNRINNPPNTEFFSIADKSNITPKELKEQIYSIENKTIALLPIYSEQIIDPNILAELNNYLHSSFISNQKFNNKYLIVSNQYNEDNQFYDNLSYFQQLLYQVSISEKETANILANYLEADLHLTMQINNWPTINNPNLGAQIRLIDGSSAVVIWHAGNLEPIDVYSKNVQFTKSLIDQFVILFNDQFD